MENPLKTRSAPNAELYETEANPGSDPETPRNAAKNVAVRKSKESRGQAHLGNGRVENKANKTSNLKRNNFVVRLQWRASLNTWSEEEKGMYLAVSLRG